MPLDIWETKTKVSSALRAQRDENFFEHLSHGHENFLGTKKRLVFALRYLKKPHKIVQALRAHRDENFFAHHSYRHEYFLET